MHKVNTTEVAPLRGDSIGSLAAYVKGYISVSPLKRIERVVVSATASDSGKRNGEDALFTTKVAVMGIRARNLVYSCLQFSFDYNVSAVEARKNYHPEIDVREQMEGLASRVERLDPSNPRLKGSFDENGNLVFTIRAKAA